MKQSKRFSTIVLGLSLMSGAWAADVSAVDSHQCALMKGKYQPFVLALRKGEQVQQAISRCANDAELKGATLVGLGAFQPVTLRYFDHEAKVYHDKVIDNFMEVTNLTGNITWVNGERQNHIHVTLSDHQFHAQAGHLKDATVGAVLEVQITPMQHTIHKEYDPLTGLDIISTS